MMKYFQALRHIDCTRLKSVTQWIWATLALVGIAVLWSGTLRAHRMLMCPGWPTVSGVIEKSELKRGFMREGSLKHQYDMMYRYTINGKNYQSGRITFAGNHAGEDIQAFLAKYRPGHKVEVRYYPKHPELAAIEAVVSWQGFKLAFFGLLLTGLGGTGFWRRWPLQSDYLFREHDPDEPLALKGVLLGTLGMLSCLGIVWLWWELIKMYAGR